MKNEGRNREDNHFNGRKEVEPIHLYMMHTGIQGDPESPGFGANARF
jgi:hypothetical protein